MKSIVTRIIAIILAGFQLTMSTTHGGANGVKSFSNSLEFAAEFFGLDSTNPRNWSRHKYEGALISVKPTQDKYRMGVKMLVSVTITNISNKAITIGVNNTIPELDYLFLLYYTNGTTVKEPDVSEGIMWQKLRAGTFDIPSSRGGMTIPENQSVVEAVNVLPSLKIEKAGTYYLRTARGVSGSTNLWLVSDKVKIEVVK